MKEKIIIALDFDTFEAAKELVDTLKDAVFFKVGLQAFLKFGPRIIDYLKLKNKRLFLDLKFKDIPNTVAGAVRSSAGFNPDFLTIHLSGGSDMVKAALSEAAESKTINILGVTVLTSMSQSNLDETGVNLTPEEAVIRLCTMGVESGMTYFVCSPAEIKPLKNKFGNKIRLITPGIRPEWSAKGDQKRVFTPKMAIDAGSDYLVIGRPVTAAANPAHAFSRILEEINS